MIKQSVFLIVLSVLAGVAVAKPMDAETAAGFKKGATASCIRGVTAQAGKRFTKVQIKSYCECHAAQLAKSLSQEDIEKGQISPQDPRIAAASKACVGRLGPIKK